MSVAQHHEYEHVVLCDRAHLFCWEYILHILYCVKDTELASAGSIIATLLEYHVPLVRGNLLGQMLADELVG